MDWTAGYVADIGYTYGYYTELNPERARLGLLNAGYDCPKFETACELGFGQGVSINIHAASTNTQWWGNDFNPIQAAHAAKMGSFSGANLTVSDDSFEEFLNRNDLPDFDFIGMNGIWSWINDHNRAVLVEFIKRKLKIGGVLYVSYNTQPGWGAFAPVRNLMTAYGEKK